MEEPVYLPSNGENKIVMVDQMEGTAKKNAGLEVSVSFGRFENDSLSWEKFSSFSPNKYLEEVERCATPGSVAQKKAYFEAHYKRIAERKAELMEQEKQAEERQSCEQGEKRVENLDSGNLENLQMTRSVLDTSESHENHFGSDASDSRCSYEEDKHVIDSASVENEKNIDERNEDTVIIKECQTQIEETKDESSGQGTLEMENPEEVVLVKEEVKEVKDNVSSKGSEVAGETAEKGMEVAKQRTPKTTKQTVKTGHTKGSKTNLVNKKTVTNKAIPTSKAKTGTMKKPVSPMTKTPGYSTPRVLKPTSMSSSVSIPRSSIRKENVSSVAKVKNPSAAGIKRVVPKSLHMSLSLDPSNSDPAALTTTRKSLIMERMGDKDIVKRAFKTFQNSYNQLKTSTDGQNTVPKQVPAKPDKVASSINLRKDSGGRSLKADSVEKKSAKPNQSSFGPRSHDRTGRRKELSKNPTDKFKVVGVEKSQSRIPTNPKGVGTNVNNRRHSLDPKSKPMAGFHSVQKTSKMSLDKEGPKKNDNTRA